MSESTTATRESSPVVEGVDHLSADGESSRRSPTGGLATYYRLRCIALETTVTALETELDRKERKLEAVRARYEEILQNRDCADGVTFAGD